ncbi:MAG: VWA domain-containing protein [Bacteroidota bacterium]|nr:VWA domain-containing protein [Bacteroidota bacterium]
MTWFKSLDVTEFILIGSFILFYLLYIVRVTKIAKRLKTGYGAVFLKVFLRTAYFSLLIIALLGPSFGVNTKEIKSVGKDIYIALDLSQSMNAFDIQPTRLEKVKSELKVLVDAFSSDRVGLIIFSSSAFVQCPLTYDQSALNLFIETLNTNLVPNTGTDFGPAISLALSKLDTDKAPLTKQTSKIIVLISDGEDFGEETEKVSKEIEADGIKLYTLGVGTREGSKIMTNTGYKKDREGNDVVTKLNPNNLKALAQKTGGKYFEINETNNEVPKLIKTINSIEGEIKDVRKVDITANKYFYFLGMALLLMFVDVLTSFKTLKI